MIYKGSLFKNRKFDFEKMLKFGFTSKDDTYFYKTTIMDKTFEMIITISKGTIDTKLIETQTNEEYTLIYLNGANGEFIGRVKEEFNCVLSEIKENCTILKAFKTELAYEIIDYIKQKYGDSPEYLWEKFPNNAVFRKRDNSKTGGKWYAAILTAKKQTIGLDETDDIELIDLKADPVEIQKITDNKKYFSGYHMNKKHWYTILLDGRIDIKEIKNRINNSYKMLLK